MKCPICGCQNFYVKDPDDEFETYALEAQGDQLVCRDETECPQIEDDTETYCDTCAWHGKPTELSKAGK